MYIYINVDVESTLASSAQCCGSRARYTTISLHLISDECPGRQIIRNFSFRQRLHLLVELL